MEPKRPKIHLKAKIGRKSVRKVIENENESEPSSEAEQQAPAGIIEDQNLSTEHEPETRFDTRF